MIHRLLDKLKMGEEAHTSADLDGSQANIHATLLTLAERAQSDRRTEPFRDDFERVIRSSKYFACELGGQSGKTTAKVRSDATGRGEVRKGKDLPTARRPVGKPRGAITLRFGNRQTKTSQGR